MATACGLRLVLRQYIIHRQIWKNRSSGSKPTVNFVIQDGECRCLASIQLVKFDYASEKGLYEEQLFFLNFVKIGQTIHEIQHFFYIKDGGNCNLEFVKCLN